MIRLSSSSPVTASTSSGAGDPGTLEHVQLGRVAEQHLMLELVLELVEPVRAPLDQRHLVTHRQQRAGDVGADLSPATIEYIRRWPPGRA